MSGVEGGKMYCYQWKEKGQCSQGDRCHHEVEVCQGREVSEAKVTMGPFFDNRADII